MNATTFNPPLFSMPLNYCLFTCLADVLHTLLAFNSKVMIERRYIDTPLEKETAINIQYVGNMVYYTVCTDQGKGVQKRKKIKNN